MRPWKPVICLAGTILTAASFSAPTVLAANPAPILYVDAAAAACTDSGPGTQAAPFCSIQAAANVVVAGQTVYIQGAPGLEYGAATITRSGTPTAPITFVGTGVNGTIPVLYPVHALASVTISGASNVVLSSLDIQHSESEDGINVNNAQHITLDRLIVNEDSGRAGVTGIAIDGQSSSVTVSRSQIFGQRGPGVAMQAGAQHITIGANYVYSESEFAGISVNGATADVTSNSVWVRCGDAVGVTGNSAVSAENNFLAITPLSTCQGPAAALAVDAASAAGVHASYNALHATAPGTEYLWSGTPYQTAAAFQAGTGQGGHDIDMPDLVPTRFAPPADSLLVDSADCGAPGELPTDLHGGAHVNDPFVADLGTGSCHADRGAIELEDPIALFFNDGGVTQGVVPFTSTITIDSANLSPWNEQVSYTTDFGDGSGPQAVSAGGSVTHTYVTPGIYQLIVTATDSGGSAVTKTVRMVVGTVSPPSDGLAAQPSVFTAPSSSGINADAGKFVVLPGPDSWEVASTAIDFGDGSSTSLGNLLSWTHLYPRPGSYTATLTTTDVFGRSATTKAAITVGDEILPINPFFVHGGNANGDFAISPHKALVLSMARLDAGGSDIAAAQLVVAIGHPSGRGSLTIYPHGSSRPAQADLDFGPGHAASGVVLAVPGHDRQVAFYNSSSRTVAVGIRTTGLEVTSNGTSGEDGDTYAPTSAVRVLDTRRPVQGVHHPVKAGQKIAFSVRSAGVPVSADQVVLDVTATNTHAPGSATVFSGKPSETAPTPPEPYWRSHQTVTSLVVVHLVGSNVSLLNSSSGSADFMVDVVGYYNFYGLGAVFLPVSKQLTEGSNGGRSVTVRAGGSVQVPVSGCRGARIADITAITAKIAVTGTTASGFVAAYQAGIARPGTRTLSYSAHEASAGMAFIPVRSGAIQLYNSGSRPVAVSVNMTGCYYHYPPAV